MKGNKKIWILIVLLGMLSVKPITAQVVLPDTDFRDFLIANYPSTINGSLELDTVVSKTITGDFNCDYQPAISDVYGIQWFINLREVDFDSDSLTYIPDISKFTQIKRLYADSNYLTSLPDLTGLTTLQVIHMRWNRLTSLPDFSTLSALEIVYVQGNQLTSLPGLTGNPLLRIFLCGENQITALPDLSNQINLEALMAPTNQLTSIPSLVNCTSLSMLRFNENQVTEFPQMNALTTLTDLRVDRNLLDSIPDLSMFPALTNVHCERNNLTFEDILPSADHPNFSSFVFMPQNKIGNVSTISVMEQETFTIDLDIDDAVNTNVYAWYKDGVLVTTTSVNQLVLNDVSMEDAGVYTCIVTNTTPGMGSISLESNPCTVVVSPCINLNNILYSVVNNNCQFPIIVNLDANSLTGTYTPFSYELSYIGNSQSVTYTLPVFQVSQEGLYNLAVKNANGCEVTTQIKVKRTETCDPIFYPDGDGIADTYYIEYSGTAKVFNLEGELVNQFSAPFYWDGRNKNGSDAPAGLYVIVVNENTTIRVTLIR